MGVKGVGERAPGKRAGRRRPQVGGLFSGWPWEEPGDAEVGRARLLLSPQGLREEAREGFPAPAQGGWHRDRPAGTVLPGVGKWKAGRACGSLRIPG